MAGASSPAPGPVRNVPNPNERAADMTILEEGASKAREVLAKVRPGTLEGRRSLPARAEPAEGERAGATADGRAAILENIPVADVSLDFGPRLEGWGTVV